MQHYALCMQVVVYSHNQPWNQLLRCVSRPTKCHVGFVFYTVQRVQLWSPLCMNVFNRNSLKL